MSDPSDSIRNFKVAHCRNIDVRRTETEVVAAATVGALAVHEWYLSWFRRTHRNLFAQSDRVLTAPDTRWCGGPTPRVADRQHLRGGGVALASGPERERGQTDRSRSTNPWCDPAGYGVTPRTCRVRDRALSVSTGWIRWMTVLVPALRRRPSGSVSSWRCSGFSARCLTRCRCSCRCSRSRWRC